ncbi:hypothetical protein JQX13_16980 [Archangium violaceum]|uniref:hypothetical protein n=1 Tax=Archangium violaceum TaxID=83451 RepID=UPI00193C731B|nr:hypothetical protein [Archangium violaceum]QRK11611.1 hypothetical protein JQX13_16980 [Archangium violaceum]
MKGWTLVLSVLLGASAAWADTLFLANNSSLNGHAGYENGRFSLEARFQGEADPSEPLFFESEAVSRVELNDNTLNMGKRNTLLYPLARFGLLAPVEQPETETNETETDPPLLPVRVVKRNGTVVHGQLVGFSEEHVMLVDEDGSEVTLPRSTVSSVIPNR